MPNIRDLIGYECGLWVKLWARLRWCSAHYATRPSPCYYFFETGPVEFKRNIAYITVTCILTPLYVKQWKQTEKRMKTCYWLAVRSNLSPTPSIGFDVFGLIVIIIIIIFLSERSKLVIWQFEILPASGGHSK